MHPACSMKPKPIVMMLSMSLSTTARMNSRTRPPHRNRIMSRPGVRSDRPVIKAKKVGKVAQCKTITASHPNVSADILCRCTSKNVFTDSILNCISLSVKNMSANFFNSGQFPTWAHVVCMIV